MTTAAFKPGDKVRFRSDGPDGRIYTVGSVGSFAGQPICNLTEYGDCIIDARDIELAHPTNPPDVSAAMRAANRHTGLIRPAGVLSMVDELSTIAQQLQDMYSRMENGRAQFAVCVAWNNIDAAINIIRETPNQ